MSGNPIQFTSRTFNTVLTDINSDPELIDKPEWFKRLIAGLGDTFSVQLNAHANDSLLRTAFTRRAVADLMQLIDQQLAAQSTSSGIMIIYFNATTVSFPKTVIIADLVAISPGSLVIPGKRFEARSSLIVSAFSETFTVNVPQDELTVSRVYTTGEKVRLTTTDTLPGGLALLTDYYAIKISDAKIQLAISINNAFAGTFIDITDNGTGMHTITLFSGLSTFFQQETISNAVTIGTSDGVTEFQEFDLPDALVLDDTLIITINAVTYTKITTFVNSISTDEHFKVLQKSDFTFAIQFGDGTFGKIPPAFDVLADYANGGGADSNISTLNVIKTYGGTDSDVTDVTNATTFTGGADEQNIENAKKLGPLLLKSLDLFVQTENGIALAESFPGVAKAGINKNAFGVLSAQVLIIPNGGGIPSATLKSDLQAFLIDRTILESMDIRVEDQTLVTVSVTGTAKILSGFLFIDVQPFIELALTLRVDETGQEIKEDFDANGIDSARILINNFFATSFLVTDNPQITTLLQNLTPTEFGRDMEASDILGYVDSFVNGVDSFSTTVPTFPVVVADNEITSAGTHTITEA